MDENVLTPTQTEIAPPADLPPLDLNQLQALAQAELEEVCRRFDVRIHPGRTRHHHILDLVRCALSQSVPVTAEGFFDQVTENFGLLRFPALR